jgi:hypothetical protein
MDDRALYRVALPGEPRRDGDNVVVSVEGIGAPANGVCQIECGDPRADEAGSFGAREQ